jgi:hypothetical protein
MARRDDGEPRRVQVVATAVDQNDADRPRVDPLTVTPRG